MPDLTGYSRTEVINLMDALGYEYKIDGYGYVTSQSIEPGKDVNKEVKITLSNKYEESS